MQHIDTPGDFDGEGFENDELPRGSRHRRFEEVFQLHSKYKPEF